MSSAIPDDAWDKAVELIRGPGPVVLACHVSPDGDALGSMLATGLALEATGHPVHASFGDEPFALPSSYGFLPGTHLLCPPSELPGEPAVLMTFDTSSRDRLGLLVPLLERAGQVIVVDHHERGDGFGDLRLVDVAAAATAVLAAELVDRIGAPLSADIAACIYTGLTTDTGSFKFAATTAKVHELAARLLATGMRHDLIARAVWDTNAFGYVRLLGAALGRAALEPSEAGGRGLVWTYVTASDLVEHELAVEDVEGLIDVLRTTSEADVAAVLKQDSRGEYKVSTRSRGQVDVGGVCASLGGGGHRYAAGYNSAAGLWETVAALRAALAAAG